MIDTISLDKIYIRLFDDNGIVNPYKMENTPHYKLLTENSNEYAEYYDRVQMLGRAKAGYMSDVEYQNFAYNFKYLEGDYSTDYIRVKQEGDRYESWDGDHRLVCLKVQGKTEAQIEVVQGVFKHKGFSNLIDVLEVLKGLDNYAVIKSEDWFPDYFDYDDMDIICGDRNKLTDIILDRLEYLKDDGYMIKTTKKGIRNHVDIIPPNNQTGDRLNFRFDIMDDFPYSINHQGVTIDVDKKYLKFALDRLWVQSIPKPVAFDPENVDVFGLNIVDDLVIRFLEWAWQPHKLRHIKRFRRDFDFHKHGEEFISIIDKYTNLDMDENYIDMLFTDLKNRGI
jgi:hypothetical protein